VKNNDQKTNLFNSETSINKNSDLDQIKTTNVNILLNRVRLDQKKTLKKRIIFSLFLTITISCLAVYFII